MRACSENKSGWHLTNFRSVDIQIETPLAAARTHSFRSKIDFIPSVESGNLSAHRVRQTNCALFKFPPIWFFFEFYNGRKIKIAALTFDSMCLNKSRDYFTTVCFDSEMSSLGNRRSRKEARHSASNESICLAKYRIIGESVRKRG